MRYYAYELFVIKQERVAYATHIQPRDRCAHNQTEQTESYQHCGIHARIQWHFAVERRCTKE